MDSEEGDHSSVNPGPYGALHLGATRQQFDPAQPTEQGLAEPPPVGGLDPAAEADRGGGDHDVGRLVDQLLGGGEEFAVVGERHDAQGGRVLDDGAASLEQSPEFVGPTRGRHTHGEPREGPQSCPAGRRRSSSMALVSRWGSTYGHGRPAGQRPVTGPVPLDVTRVTSDLDVAELRLRLCGSGRTGRAAGPRRYTAQVTRKHSA